jgi:hypothetical protein
VDDGGTSIPIIDLRTMSTESVNGLRRYPVDNPPHIVQHLVFTKRSYKTLHRVCNQPRRRKCSNHVVKFIIPMRLDVPKLVGIVDLDEPVIDLSSDKKLGLLNCIRPNALKT